MNEKELPNNNVFIEKMMTLSADGLGHAEVFRSAAASNCHARKNEGPTIIIAATRESCDINQRTANVSERLMVCSWRWWWWWWCRLFLCQRLE
jgi:hypothetical protein